jgi:hypothetical protein
VATVFLFYSYRVHFNEREPVGEVRDWVACHMTVLDNNDFVTLGIDGLAHPIACGQRVQTSQYNSLEVWNRK